MANHRTVLKMNPYKGYEVEKLNINGKYKYSDSKVSITTQIYFDIKPDETIAQAIERCHEKLRSVIIDLGDIDEWL